ncbi:hypothetical protein PM3016_1405 [Paenibacillus mucilaginosus 3016]|uniref:Protein-glutamine gamma-glutamyltransferase-like C-terminal domain-containing protein n=1 Tax=Paenibacillus mucilaginosus 3016 TaxID=1116391 RepID=H6NEM6_9BACL|nr:DUF4129 domain-containing protein [Paenibacillus mucilaginosus]AFC28330.1 hypothetical protein PM3016_1405 [Paenibacillus mucilaginosus 3016]
MKNTLRPLLLRGLRALLQGAAELLLFLPLPLLLAVYALPAPGRWLWLASLPLLYAAGCALALRLPQERRLTRHTVAAAFGLLQAVCTLGAGLPALLALPAGWLLARRGARMAAEPWALLFPPPAFAAGLLLQFAASFVLQFVPSFAPYLPLLLWGGLAALGTALFRMNRIRLQDETLNRSSSAGSPPALPPAVLWPNRLWTALLLAGVLLLAFGSALEAALREGLTRLAAFLLGLLPQGQEPPPEAAPPAAPPSPPALPPSEPPPAWLQWLEQALLYAAGALLTLLAAYLLYRLARRLPGRLRRLLAWLAERMNPAQRSGSAEGYEDEVVSLLRAPSAGRSGQGLQRGTRLREPRWEDLRSGGERVRYLYREWLRGQRRRGLQAPPQWTPAETVREAAAANGAAAPGPAAGELLRLYESVRYGEKPVSDEEAAQLRSRLEAETASKPKR